jgi:hypothetical protein
MYGPIGAKLAALTGSARGSGGTSWVGYPTSEPTYTSNGIGQYATFQSGMILHSPGTGAHVMGSPERDYWLAPELTRMFANGFEEAVRYPEVVCSLRRLARRPRVLALGESVKSATGGSPGSTGGASEGPWEYVVHGIEKCDRTQDRRAKGVFVLVAMTLTSWGSTAGGMDGRDLVLEESNGDRHPPAYDATVAECARRGVTGPHGTVWPRNPFEAVLLYDVPREARRLRLLLPFGGVEYPLP